MSTSKSSSIHTLNADERFGANRFAIWKTLNRINNLAPLSRRDNNIVLRKFSCDWAKFWDDVPIKASPCRRLGDLFLRTLPWERLRAPEAPIVIYDLGCGSGNLSRRIAEWSGAAVSYHGFDVRARSNWEELMREEPGVHLQTFDGRHFASTLTQDFDVFLSHSALEHVVDDLSFFMAVQEYVKRTDKPVLQVHLVPTRQCLPLFGHHGVRQYTPRTLSKITRLFPDCRCSVVGLGGGECTNLHLEFISNPIKAGKPDRRETETVSYIARLRSAIEADVDTAVINAHYHALVIEFGFERPFLDDDYPAAPS